MTDYRFRTVPYAHQKKAFDLCKNKDAFALLMEQGTGKTKVAIDKACYQFCEGHIDAVLIVAPNGIHRNWLDNELPAHVPDYIPYEVLLWNKSLSTFQKNYNNVINKSDKLIFFAINIEALATDKGRDFAKRFLVFRKVLMVLDESSRIKTPSTQRAKSAILLGKYAQEKLILTGTPVTQSPFDLYAQFKFLDPHILGNQTYTSFKHEYGIFQRKVNFKTGYPYDLLEQYKNLDALQQLIAPHSFRVTKDQCLDLPEKIYQRYSIDLSTQQRHHYDRLRDELFTIIQGEEIVTPIILTNLLRLQQVTGGFIDINGEVVAISEDNPKIDLMMELFEDIPGKFIIWSRFVNEIKAIVESLKKQYGSLSTVEYWGEIGQEERAEALRRFQHDPECRFFIGNPRAAGIGLTLTAANTVIYFSNDFSLETRLQSEDRAHRIGQKAHVTYIDIEARNTLDSKIIDALREKKNIADLITGDKIKQWI